eukprot:XP_011681657.1 PREDICTED: serine/arginine repetitive matrix protein 1-like [Strongylocentrotus purpuratus]
MAKAEATPSPPPPPPPRPPLRAKPGRRRSPPSGVRSSAVRMRVHERKGCTSRTWPQRRWTQRFMHSTSQRALKSLQTASRLSRKPKTRTSRPISATHYLSRPTPSW